jgi:hypothetical protein
MRELNVDLLETLKVEGLPELADTSKSTVVAKIRCFLRDAFRRGWIKGSVANLNETARSSNRPAADHAFVRPKRRPMNAACPAMSSFANHLTCALRTMFIVSIR